MLLIVVSSLLTLVTWRNNAFLAIKKIDTYWKSVMLHMMKAPTERIKRPMLFQAKLIAANVKKMNAITIKANIIFPFVKLVRCKRGWTIAKYLSIFIMMSEVADNNGVVLLTITKQMLKKHCGVPRISGIELSRNMAGTLTLLGQLQTKSWCRNNWIFASCSWTLKTRTRPVC